MPQLEPDFPPSETNRRGSRPKASAPSRATFGTTGSSCHDRMDRLPPARATDDFAAGTRSYPRD
jgi:hypothetical protein